MECLKYKYLLSNIDKRGRVYRQHPKKRLQLWSLKYEVTHSLPLLPVSGEVVPIRVPSMDQIDLFKYY